MIGRKIFFFQKKHLSGYAIYTQDVLFKQKRCVPPQKITQWAGLVTSKLSSRSTVHRKENENECEEQKEVQLNFVHEFEFKIQDRDRKASIGWKCWFNS